MTSYLWIIDLPYRSRLHNGGLLRYFNLSRELVAKGNKVTFATVIEDDREAALEWMRSLQQEGVFTNFCEMTVDAQAWSRLALVLLPFSLHGLAIRRFRALTVSRLDTLARRYSADVLLVSSNRFIYNGYEFRGCARIGDFCDSYTLMQWRDFKLVLQRREFAAAARQFVNLSIWFFRELHVCRKYDANIFVSPIDKHVFDVLGRPERNKLLSNGVRLEGSAPIVAKIPNQIIFSGTMDFPPNYDAALWFLDNVFPRVLKSHPDTVFVIAGGRPHAKLLARANRNTQVPGFLDDLNMAIAQSALYVAPMRSGSGFKNKVAEAIANKTRVIGTTLAVEFLNPSLREFVTVRDDPAEMAEAIAELLDDPAASAAGLDAARETLAEQCSWPAKATELDGVVQSLRVPR